MPTQAAKIVLLRLVPREHASVLCFVHAFRIQAIVIHTLSHNTFSSLVNPLSVIEIIA